MRLADRNSAAIKPKRLSAAAPGRKIAYMISHRIRLFTLAAAVLFASFCLAGCSGGFVFRAEQSAEGERYILEQYTGKQEHVVLPDTYRGAPVYAIWPHAFPYLTESVDVGAVKYIYREAFAGMGMLRHVDLGEAEILEHSVFTGCRALETIVIPATVQTLGDGIFANCNALRSVYFEGDPQTLGNNIFPVHEETGAALTIYGCAGGSVEAYAKAVGIPFEVWDASDDTAF